MKRVAVLIWQPALTQAVVAAVDEAAQSARREGKALHFYVLTPDQQDTARYRHASVEYIAAIGWRRAWVVARLLQQLLVRYDLACLAGISPALAFFCRGYRMKLLAVVNGEWSPASSFSISQLLLGRRFSPASSIPALPALPLQAEATNHPESRE
ncbi:MAG: hypothetical protein K0S46_1492 [Moraxellaceae bacterium]|jgi:hypothetical protein|nr:hypothetical protein [Moraxellaceae bacterium]